MEPIKGSCNCGSVSFAIKNKLPALYQCHCSLCQKQSGASSNASTMVKIADFDWLSGTEQITQWQKPTGFSSHFCKSCGSPVPNLFRSSYMWIPAGLLNQATSKIIAHICLSSKQAWDLPVQAIRNYQTMPENIDEFIGFLYSQAE